MKKPLNVLDRVVDRVLAYKPKRKPTKPEKRRVESRMRFPKPAVLRSCRSAG